jgi:deoxyribonuclease-4
MKIGLHVSISGSVDKAVDNATSLNCTAFQIFTGNPRGWALKELVDEEVENFKKKLYASGIEQYAVCAHMSYLPNLSTSKKRLHNRSLKRLVNELERCEKLDIPYLVTHLGRHGGEGIEVGIRNLVKTANAAVAEVSDVMILLENMEGAKNSVGARFEELAKILDHLEPRKRFGVCLDTCHAFAAGYDLRSKDAVGETIAAFDKHIGMKELRVVHLNDSMSDISCHRDRHEHIGMGFIGEGGFRTFLANKEIRKRPLILETPIDERRDDLENLQKVRELASQN